MSKQQACSPTEKDLRNVEAWTVVIADLLYRVPCELRLEVLTKALADEQAKAAEREADDGSLKFYDLGDPENMDTPGLRQWNVVMRLKSMLVQAFVRNISNNHSPENASAILFAHHRHGTGSGLLADYLRYVLPRPKTLVGSDDDG
jgi:hypothetical protein